MKVAVIGAGRLGGAFALRCAAAGLDVVLEDVMPANLRRAQDAYAAIGSDGVLAAGFGRLEVAGTVEDAVREADIAVDFVPDELESKLEIFSLLDRMAPPRTVLCTPTDALSVTDLASCTYRAALCVGVRGGLAGDSVEVVRSRFVGEEALVSVMGMLARVGIAARVVEDRQEPMLVKNSE